MELSSEAVHYALALLFRDSGVRAPFQVLETEVIPDRCADQPRWAIEGDSHTFWYVTPFKRKREKVLAFVVGSS